MAAKNGLQQIFVELPAHEALKAKAKQLGAYSERRLGTLLIVAGCKMTSTQLANLNAKVPQPAGIRGRGRPAKA